MSMTPEDQELDEYLDGISYTDNKDRDWKAVPELGEDPDDDDEDDDTDDDEDDDTDDEDETDIDSD